MLASRGQVIQLQEGIGLNNSVTSQRYVD